MATKEELLVYGYIKEYFQLRKENLPPNDIILLLISWIELMDTFDKNKFVSDGSLQKNTSIW